MQMSRHDFTLLRAKQLILSPSHSEHCSMIKSKLSCRKGNLIGGCCILDR